jgi:hypothetical protein
VAAGRVFVCFFVRVLVCSAAWLVLRLCVRVFVCMCARAFASTLTLLLYAWLRALCVCVFVCMCACVAACCNLDVVAVVDQEVRRLEVAMDEPLAVQVVPA